VLLRALALRLKLGYLSHIYCKIDLIPFYQILSDLCEDFVSISATSRMGRRQSRSLSRSFFAPNSLRHSSSAGLRLLPAGPVEEAKARTVEKQTTKNPQGERRQWWTTGRIMTSEKMAGLDFKRL
jgi:hypothetical protein